MEISPLASWISRACVSDLTAALPRAADVLSLAATPSRAADVQQMYEPERHAFARERTHELAHQLAGFAEAGRAPDAGNTNTNAGTTRGGLLHRVTAVPSTVADVPSPTAAYS
ncbi:hypothetical protein BJ912DRAFT_1062324 [Pholiota molesta]|nr:hypothetical protein BJ912DRAFT_1062324 [Pholiota molesta]